MKTSELTRTALDWAVAKVLANADDSFVAANNPIDRPQSYTFRPSTDWSQGGPIIEREKISTNYRAGGEYTTPDWRAVRRSDRLFGAGNEEFGPTPLIAAMRCFVASRLGDEIDLPKELM